MVGGKRRGRPKKVVGIFAKDESCRKNLFHEERPAGRTLLVNTTTRAGEVEKMTGVPVPVHG